MENGVKFSTLNRRYLGEMKIRDFKFLILLILALLGSNSYSQEKINVSAGIALPELLNAGLRYQFRQAQWGLYAGVNPGNANEIAVSTDLSLHFGKIPKFSPRKVGYVKFGITYLREESDFSSAKSTLLTGRIGRDINLSRKFGLGIDGGVLFKLHTKRIEKQPSWFEDTELFPIVFPAAGINLFYRL